jgi:hypothetical protein
MVVVVVELVYMDREAMGLLIVVEVAVEQMATLMEKEGFMAGVGVVQEHREQVEMALLELFGLEIQDFSHQLKQQMNRNKYADVY